MCSQGDAATNVASDRRDAIDCVMSPLIVRWSSMTYESRRAWYIDIVVSVRKRADSSPAANARGLVAKAPVRVGSQK